MLVVGVDIGGSKIRGILWNGGRIIRVHEFPTPKDKNGFEKRMSSLIALLARQRRVSAIGIGAAGIVEKTTLISSPNIPYIKDCDFRRLRPRSIPLRLDNDARCFARAEFLVGAARGSKSLFAFTIGTGVGRAYGEKGKIQKRKKFEYPEPWEKKYQLLRDAGDDVRLANFLSEKLGALLIPFEPEVVVLGGGVMERRGFALKLQASLRAQGPACKIRRARLGKSAVAIGGALLF